MIYLIFNLNSQLAHRAVNLFFAKRFQMRNVKFRLKALGLQTFTRGFGWVYKRRGL